MKLRNVLIVFLSLFLFGCSSSSNDDKEVEKIKTVFEFSKPEKEIPLGDKVSLFYSLALSNIDISKIKWSSSKPEVASFEEDILNPHQEGEIVVTASVENTDLKTTMKVIVSKRTLYFKQERVEIDPKQWSIKLEDYLFVKHLDKEDVRWENHNPEIIKVERGIVTIVNDGEAYVYAVLNRKGMMYRSGMYIVVKGLGITYVRIIPKDKKNEIRVNEKYQYRIEYAPKNNDPSQLVWTSTNSSIATVDRSGVVQGKAIGKAFIVVTSPGSKESSSVEVNIIPEIE